MRSGVLWLVLLLLAACDGAVPRLTVTPDRLTLWAEGQSARLELREEGGERVLAADRWQSLDERVVAVDAEGRVVARGAGETEVLAWRDGRSARARVVVDPDGVTLNGRIFYADRLYDAQGLTGEQRLRPLRHARWAVVDEAGNLRLQGTTDGEGRFDLGALVPLGLRLVVYSEADGVSVLDPERAAPYAVSLPLEGVGTTPLEWRLEQVELPLGAFNILDTLLYGREFVAQITQTPLPPLAAYWAPAGSSGTYYCTGAAGQCPQGEGIYVLEGWGDSDAFDDDVLWHEFGHFLSHKLSRDSSPGGCHFLQSLDLDLRLAWSEGWGDFLPAAVKDWLEATQPGGSSLAEGAATSLYVDTDGSGPALLSFDVAGASSYYRYASNEIAVAALLWQLRQRYGMAAIWRVLEGYLPIAQGPVNLETLWDGWLVLNPPGGAILTLENLWGAREIFYRNDEFEDQDDPNAPRLLSPGSSEWRTLYGPGDVDIAAVYLTAGQSVVIRTSELGNGADTELRLYAPDGSLAAVNDDDPAAPPHWDYDPLCAEYRAINDGLRLVSRVEFTAVQSGVHRIEVSTTRDPEPYPSTGRYGHYWLHVESP